MHSKLMLVLCLLASHFVSYSQTPSSSQTNTIPKKIPNTTRLELVYKKALIIEYGGYGSSGRSFMMSFPYMRVNDGKPVAIDNHADNLRNYFSKCWAAEEQLDLMNENLRKARVRAYTSYGIGTAIALSTLFTFYKNPEAPLTTFYGRVALGGAVSFVGAYIARRYAHKADENLRMSVELYNSGCYKQTREDSIRLADSRAAAAAGGPIVSGRPSDLRPRDPQFYEDTVRYGLERNEPSHSGLFGVAINPVVLDLSSVNLNIGGGGGLFYTYKSKLIVSGEYKYAYLDNLTGDNNRGEPIGSYESYGVPTSYKKSTNLQLLARYSVKSWEKESSYHLTLGNTKIGRLNAVAIGRATGLITRAIAARVGYIADNRVIESKNGLDFTNSSPQLPIKYQNTTVMLSPTNLRSSSTMMKSGIITAGIGLTTFRDLKMKLQDSEFKGRRSEQSQTELYFDVMYAHSLLLQDIVYYHPVSQFVNYDHQAQTLDISQTPMSKLGARIGCQTLSMIKPNFGVKYNIEAGIRPGIASLGMGETLYAQITWGVVIGGRN